MLSVSESAEVLGVSTARVRQLIANGSLEATKVGGSWCIPEASVYDRLSKHPSSGRPVASDGETLSSFEEQRSNQAMHELYLQCKKAFSSFLPLDVVESAETQEEANFYMAVGDFFLREKQWELVKRGVF